MLLGVKLASVSEKGKKGRKAQEKTQTFVDSSLLFFFFVVVVVCVSILLFIFFVVVLASDCGSIRKKTLSLQLLDEAAHQKKCSLASFFFFSALALVACHCRSNACIRCRQFSFSSFVFFSKSPLPRIHAHTDKHTQHHVCVRKRLSMVCVDTERTPIRKGRCAKHRTESRPGKKTPQRRIKKKKGCWHEQRKRKNG